MTSILTAPVDESTNVRSPYHKSTHSIAVALRRLADELIEAPNRDIAETILSVGLQVRSGSSPQGARVTTVDTLLTLVATGVETNVSPSWIYGNRDDAAPRSDMLLSVFTALDKPSLPTVTPASQWIDVLDGEPVSA
jgi:hypothetical protein